MKAHSDACRRAGTLILVSSESFFGRIVCVGTLVVMLVSTASAQLRYRPTDIGPWRPWHMTATSQARQSRAATAAEVQAWQARLQELAAIVRRGSAVAQPVGFAAELWGNLDSYGPPGKSEPAGTKIPLAGSLSFGAFPLIEFMRNGKLANEDMRGGETQLLHFTLNRIDSGMFSQSMPTEWSGGEAIGFVQPRTRDTVAGVLTRIDDVMVLISDKNRDRPLWAPIILEEAMAPVLAQRRNLLENRRGSLEKQRREFDQWLTPAKRTERQAQWKQTATALGEQKGREFLANMEKSEADIEKHNRAVLAPGGAEERGVQEAERNLREAEGVLAAAPAVNTKAACYDKSASQLAARFRVMEGAPPSCEPLVKTNWAFFDPGRPRTDPQVLMLVGLARCLTAESLAAGDATRGGCTINRKLVESLDWEAVRAWMNR